jgi:hypothetical protein
MTEFVLRYGIAGLVFITFIIIWNCANGHSFSWLFIICYVALVPLVVWFSERVEGEARRIGTLLGRRWQQAKKQP